MAGLLSMVLVVVLSMGDSPASAGTPASHTVLAASSTSPSSPTTLPGIQVGPAGTTTPTAPTEGSSSSVDGSSASSPGLFDITGHIEAAIDSWFSDLVTSALDPVLTVLGQTLLATPDVTGQPRVGELWSMTQGIADACLVLFVLAGGAIVMGHETIQTRTALKDIAPRIVVAAVAANASLGLAGLAISTADSLSQAVLGQGVDPAQATVVLRQLIFGSLAGGGIFVTLLGLVVAILAVVLLATFVIRLVLVVLLIVAAPMALVCHALPQTEGLARLWWRAFFGTLAVQVAQSLVLVTALRVFLASGGPASIAVASTGGMVDLLVSACLCWVLVKIPTWVGRLVFSGGGRRRSGGATRIVRDVVVYKGIKALAAGVGL
ncbi:MAG: hypothetical protein ACRDYE_00740 [Acidimicrobiales bacterium]